MMGGGKENQENVECWAQKPKGILKHRDAVTAEPGRSDGCGAKLERALRASNRHESGGAQCAHAEEDTCPVMTISLSDICDRGASANMVQTLATKEEHNKSSPVEACESAGSQAHATAAVSATTISVSPWIDRRRRRLDRAREMAQLLQAREMAQLSNQLVVTSLKPEREQVHKGDPDKVDLCMLLQDANNEAGSQGISAFAEILTEAGLLGNSECKPLQAVATADQNTDKIQYHNNKTYDNIELPLPKISTPHRDTTTLMDKSADGQSQCTCIACTSTMASSPLQPPDYVMQPKRTSTSPQNNEFEPKYRQIDLPVFGLKFKFLFMWRFSMRDRTIAKARKRKALLAARIPTLAASFVCWRTCLDSLRSSSISHHIPPESAPELRGKSARREAKGTGAAQGMGLKPRQAGASDGMSGCREEDTHDAEAEADDRLSASPCLSSSECLPLAPSPTPCAQRAVATTRSSTSPSLASSPSLSAFTPSNALQQLLLDATSVNDNLSTDGVEPSSADADARRQVPNSTSGREVSGFWMLLSPEDHRQSKENEQAVWGRPGAEKSKGLLPAVTPTLSRRRARRHPRMIPPVTPTLARGPNVREAKGCRTTSALKQRKSVAALQPMAMVAADNGDCMQRSQVEVVVGVQKQRPGRNPKSTRETFEGEGIGCDTLGRQSAAALEYPGFFQQVRELQARGLLTGDQGNQLCERALRKSHNTPRVDVYGRSGARLFPLLSQRMPHPTASKLDAFTDLRTRMAVGDRRLAALYKERKRRHLQQGVRLQGDSREGTGTSGRDLCPTHEPFPRSAARASSKSDWRDFASALKRLLI